MDEQADPPACAVVVVDEPDVRPFQHEVEVVRLDQFAVHSIQHLASLPYNCLMVSTELALSRPNSGQKQVRLTPKKRAWLSYYLGQAAFNATEAARLAGYPSARVEGSRLAKEFKQEIEAHLLKLEEAQIAGPREVLQILTGIARDREHKDCKAAADTLAKIHGLMQDKVSVSLDRKALMRDLEAVLAALQPILEQQNRIQQVIEVEATSTTTK